MISNPFFLLSIFLSSVLAFYGTAFIVEVVVRLVRLKSYRTRSSLRLIPFFILSIDLLFNQYSIANWINPLSCASCVQKFTLEMFFPELKTFLIQNKTSLISYLGIRYQHGFFIALFGFFGAMSLYSVLGVFRGSFSSIRLIRLAQENSKLSSRQIESIKLKQVLQKNKVDIYVCTKVQIPLAIYPKTIIVPKNAMEILSQQEYEAVIAHEIEHIRNRDSIIRLLYHVIAAFFWWIPMHFWMRKIEEEQELACDQSVLKYNLSGDSIASSLLKVARQVKLHRAICCFTNSDNSIVLRVQDALGIRIKEQYSACWIAFLGVVLWSVFLVICIMYK